jgi:hypothetical protein
VPGKSRHIVAQPGSECVEMRGESCLPNPASLEMSLDAEGTLPASLCVAATAFLSLEVPLPCDSVGKVRSKRGLVSTSETASCVSRIRVIFEAERLLSDSPGLQPARALCPQPPQRHESVVFPISTASYLVSAWPATSAGLAAILQLDLGTGKGHDNFE